MTTQEHQRLRGAVPATHRLGRLVLAPLLLATAAAGMAGLATADSRSVAITTHQGIRLKLNLPAGSWRADDRIEGFVRVTNTNDRTAWFLDTDCRDIGVEVRVHRPRARQGLGP